MKARLPVEVRLSNRQKQAVREYIDIIAPEMFRKYMMLTAVSLNESHGFGKGRLCKLFDELAVLVECHAPDDEIFWEHTEKRCKQLGLSEYFNLGEN